MVLEYPVASLFVMDRSALESSPSVHVHRAGFPMRGATDRASAKATQVVLVLIDVAAGATWTSFLGFARWVPALTNTVLRLWICGCCSVLRIRSNYQHTPPEVAAMGLLKY